MNTPAASSAQQMQYNYVSPGKIVFGWERFAEVGGLARELGQRAFIVCGSRTLKQNGRIGRLQTLLRENGVASIELADIAHEPEVVDVDQAAAALAEYLPKEGDLVIAIGGGAALDLGKAVAAMAVNRESETVQDYLEGVGQGLELTVKPLPVLAIPTTAGTGSEVTKNAVISCYDPAFKKSLRSEAVVPRTVLVDPELTVSLPASVTAAAGMDAITQLIESYISRRAQPIPRALCLLGLELAVPSLVRAIHQPGAREPREKMSQAALLSGLALANSGLGMAHGVAAALGVHCRIAHGLACAVMLPHAMKANRDVALADLATLGRMFDRKHQLDDDVAADTAIARIENLGQLVGIPPKLSKLGMTVDQIPAIVQSSRGNSMNGNPRDVSDDELTVMLEGLL